MPVLKRLGAAMERNSEQVSELQRYLTRKHATPDITAADYSEVARERDITSLSPLGGAGHARARFCI